MLGSFALFYYTFTTVMMWISQNQAEASFWNKMGSVWPFTVVLIATFALAFTKSKWLKNKLTYLALYLPALFFFLIDLFTNLINEPPVLRYWGFNDVASGTWLYYSSTFWSAALTIGAFIVCAHYYFKTEDTNQKKPRLLVTIGLAVPIVAFVVTNLIARSFSVETPNLGPITAFVFSSFVAYAILKYDLFTFDAAIAADNIISTLPDAFALINMQGKILKVNEHLLNFLGYNENELIGKSIEKLQAEKDYARWSDELKKLSEKEAIESSELTCKTKNGEEKVILFSGSVIQTNLERNIGLACLFHDVTERKKSLEMQQKQAALIDLSLSAMIVKNTNGIITFWNSGAEKLYGYKKEEAVGKEISLLLKVRHSDSEEKILDYLKKGRHWVGEITQYTKENKEVIVQTDWVATLNEQGEILEILESNIDITDRRKAQKATELSEEKFRKTFTLSPVGISIFNLVTNRFVDCNESFEILTDYLKEEIIGKSSQEINFWTHQLDRSQIVDSLLKEGFAQIQGLELTTKSNETRVVDACFVTVSINGELHSISNLLDITERQKAERELKENHSQIENLNEKLKVLGSLTRHDVKNKLMVLKGNAYLLRKRLANSPELLTYIEAIEVAINQSDRLLELSRIYEQIGSEKLTKINVEECFNQAFSLMNKPGLQIINKCQGLTINADSMLGQLFYNLIDNSLKHGKTVTEVKLWFNSEASVINLYYEDNGVGIIEANKSLIFSEGFTTGGSGLGLKLVKKMIESYGWSIEENGIPNNGARFQITIPKSALFY